METVKVAMAGIALLPLLVLQCARGQRVDVVPAAVAAVTFTVTVQAPLAGNRASRQRHARAPWWSSFRRKCCSRCLRSVCPLGNVSVSGAVRLAMAPLALPKVMVRVESPPVRMVAGLKALPSMGATFTAGIDGQVAMAGAALVHCWSGERLRPRS